MRLGELERALDELVTIIRTGQGVTTETVERATDPDRVLMARLADEYVTIYRELGDLFNINLRPAQRWNSARQPRRWPCAVVCGCGMR